jgi:hypothetical protein
MKSSALQMTPCSRGFLVHFGQTVVKYLLRGGGGGGAYFQIKMYLLRMRDSYTNPNESSNFRFLFSRNESTKRIFPNRPMNQIHDTNPDSRVQNLRILEDSDW